MLYILAALCQGLMKPFDIQVFFIIWQVSHDQQVAALRLGSASLPQHFFLLQGQTLIRS